MKLDRSIHKGAIKQIVTSVTLANDTLKIIDTVVPTGKRWLLMGIKATNPDDVERGTTFTVFKEAGKTNYLKQLSFDGLAAGIRMQWPSNATGAQSRLTDWAFIILAEGNTIEVKWLAGGASAGGTDADGLVIEYLEFPA